MSTDVEKPFIRDIEWRRVAYTALWVGVIFWQWTTIWRRDPGTLVLFAVLFALALASSFGEALVRRATLRSIRASIDGVATRPVRIVRRFYNVAMLAAAVLLLTGVAIVVKPPTIGGMLGWLLAMGVAVSLLQLLAALISIRRMGRI